MMTIGDYPRELAVGYLINQNMLRPDDVVHDDLVAHRADAIAMLGRQRGQAGRGGAAGRGLRRGDGGPPWQRPRSRCREWPGRHWPVRTSTLFSSPTSTAITRDARWR